MPIRRLFDEVQLRLHVLGLHRLAEFFGRFGTREEYPKLRVINYDPVRSSMQDIDVDKDIAWPKTKLDVN